MRIRKPEQNSYRWQNTRKRRFYQAYLQRDMLNDWVITCVWGGMDSRLGNHQHHAFKSLKEAIRFIDGIKARRQLRGYSLIAE